MRNVFFLLFLFLIIAGSLAALLNTLPLRFFLIIYLIIIIAFAVFTAFNLYHAWRFGSLDFINFFTLFLYIVCLLILIYFSYNFITSVDWSQDIQISL